MAVLVLPVAVHLAVGLLLVWQLRQPAPRVGGEEHHRKAAPGPVPIDSGPHNLPAACCLVAARDESANIDACLAALTAQSVPLDIVVIDDHSSDDTATKVAAWSRHFPDRVRLISGGPGKVAALQAGFEQSEAACVLTTDADCRPPQGWAQGLLDHLPAFDTVGGTTMVRAGAPIEQLDWAILLGTAAASSELGKPLTAMGNNMAFRRRALQAAGGFDAAGDSVTEDYALFRLLARRGPVGLVMTPETLNWTEPVGSLAALFRQRRRWALGATESLSGQNAAVLLGTFIAYLAPWLLLALAPAVALACFVLRWMVQAALAGAVADRLKIRLPLAWVPAHDLLISLYTVAIPFTLASRRTRWKGRTRYQGS
ncbi:MAG: glycosyltransferase [Rhodothermales bacterium]|nr:glycosyltransferase [Rhodothermales bacterium]MBO6779881.1 glycosyltransferase [Rhodothermales bacterium]